MHIKFGFLTHRFVEIISLTDFLKDPLEGQGRSGGGMFPAGNGPSHEGSQEML